MTYLQHIYHSLASSNGSTGYSFKDMFLGRPYLHRPPYGLRYVLNDDHPDLVLIHSTPSSSPHHAVVEECNGIIYEKQTFQLVAYGMDKLREGHGIEVFDTIANLGENDGLDPDDAKVDIEESEDGTVIKIYNWRGKWIVSTNKTIDARRARWSSTKSFLQMTYDAVGVVTDEQFQEKMNASLSPTSTYSFVLVHPENHLVVRYSTPALVFASSRDMRHRVETKAGPEASWYVYPSKIDKEAAIQRLSSNERWLSRGIIVSRKGNNGSYIRYKVDYPWYARINPLRQNQPTMELSYLACSPTEREQLKQDFAADPLSVEAFDACERKLAWTYEQIMSKYIMHEFAAVKPATVEDPDLIPIFDQIKEEPHLTHNEGIIHVDLDRVKDAFDSCSFRTKLDLIQRYGP